MRKKTKYYSLDRILEINPTYAVIIGERSNGKTYACLKHCIEEYVKNGSQFAIVRRWQDDFKGKRASVMFDGLVANDVIAIATNYEWTAAYYYAMRWFFCRYEDGKRITASEPFAYAFAISAMEHDKSTSYPNIRNILFDEFLTREHYLPNEFILWQNVVSTIVRDRDDIKIFMCANTVSQYSPYFTEMGLKNIKKMTPGDIQIYYYGENSDTVVAVEFSDSGGKGKASDKYFAFNNAKLQMITKGAWELEIYPHCPYKFTYSNIKCTYFIIYDGEILQCEVVKIDNCVFTYIHRKSTPIQKPNKDIIFQPEADYRPNYNKRITHPTSAAHKKVAQYFKDDYLFYQDNDVGELVRNYIEWCNQ